MKIKASTKSVLTAFLILISFTFTSCSIFQSKKSRLMSRCQRECYYKDPGTLRYTPAITWSNTCRCMLD